MPSITPEVVTLPRLAPQSVGAAMGGSVGAGLESRAKSRTQPAPRCYSAAFFISG
jgi:hypothetical protein